MLRRCFLGKVPFYVPPIFGFTTQSKKFKLIFDEKGRIFFMIVEYIEAALAKANYEIIRDEEPYYGEIPGLKGVWATGKTLEECRKRLAEVIEGWIIIRLKKGLPIPPLGKYRIKEPKELSISG
jgi:predicted RNase H-like HicB family nuclease